jgi:diacylglycerol O-acyltransferase
MAERLTAQDASFLFADRPGLPMTVGGLAVLDSSSRASGAIRPAELRRRISSRLGQLPRFRQRVSVAPLGLWRSSWVEDHEFDLDHHLAFHELPPGAGWAGLLRLAGQLQSTPLDLARPLWQVTLVDGLPRGRQALIIRTHHSIADGIAGIDVAEAIFDRPSAQGRHRHVPRFSQVEGQRPSLALRLIQSAAGVALYLSGGPLARGSLFNGRVGPRRVLVTTRLSLDDALKVKQRLGGTVDDVFLATVSLGLGPYLRRRNQPIAGRSLRAMVPVSTRGPHHAPGNRVTAIFIDLPLGRPPAACLHHITASKAVHRAWHEAMGLGSALKTGEHVPEPLEAAIVRLAAGLQFANLIVSDVPGPDRPPSLLGARLVEAYPLMPLTRCVGLSIAALSIGGTIGIGVTADPALVPDADLLARDLREGFASLARAAARMPGPRLSRSQKAMSRPNGRVAGPAHRITTSGGRVGRKPGCGTS